MSDFLFSRIQDSKGPMTQAMISKLDDPKNKMDVFEFNSQVVTVMKVVGLVHLLDRPL